MLYNGRPCITLCDNYYNNTITRAPGLMRYGYFHSFNNYVVNFDMGYTIYSACKLYSESNYFEAGTGKGSVVNDRPGSDISATYPGVYTDSGSILTGSNYSLTASYAKACTWRPTSNYSYTAKTASDVKAYCMKNAGPKSSASAGGRGTIGGKLDQFAARYLPASAGNDAALDRHGANLCDRHISAARYE